MRVDAHTPRFEQESLFFFALLGVVSFGRRLEQWLVGCGVDASVSETPNADSSGGSPGAPLATTLDCLLLGVASYRRKALEHVIALAGDVQATSDEPAAAAALEQHSRERGAVARQGGLLR